MNTQNFFGFRIVLQREYGVGKASVKLKHSPGMNYIIIEVCRE